MKRRSMHFGVFVLGTGNHSAGWRYDGAATSNNDLSVIQEIAQHAERGKFDLLFVSDGLVMDPGDHPSFLCRFEPTTLISALSASTRHIGLGATVSTSFGEPYHVARTFGSHRPHHPGPGGLERGDQLERARPRSTSAAKPTWSTTCATRSRRSSSTSSRACGTAGRTARSSRTRRPASSSIRRRSARSTIGAAFFQVKGPHQHGPCPQGHPVIIQAGGSEAGLELAARTADVVFSVVQELSARQGCLSRSEGAHGEVWPHAGSDHGAAGRDADHRKHRGGGPRQALPAPELAHADQRPAPW